MFMYNINDAQSNVLSTFGVQPHQSHSVRGARQPPDFSLDFVNSPPFLNRKLKSHENVFKIGRWGVPNVFGGGGWLPSKLPHRNCYRFENNSKQSDRTTKAAFSTRVFVIHKIINVSIFIMLLPEE